MKAVLTRFEFNDVQTLGRLEIFDSKGCVFDCKTLELEVDTNTKRDDAIPYGVYTVVKRKSLKYGDHFHIKNIPNRSYILIHSGNYYTHTLGCILVGEKHLDINKDGLKDVTNSKPTMRALSKILPDKFELEIKREFIIKP